MPDPDNSASSTRPWLDDPWLHRVAFLLVLGIALAVRLYHINQPMRLDESRTVLYYGLQPLGAALSDYRVPNNHLFSTLLIWLSVHLLGYAEWAVRLPALIAGMASVWAAYHAARRLAGRDAGLLAATLVAASPALILYSTNARGYGIVCLITLLLIPVVDALAEEQSRSRWIAFVLLLFLGAYTIPVMLYPAGGLGLWLMIEQFRRHGRAATVRFIPRIALALLVTGTLTAIAYAPILLHPRVADTPGSYNQFVAALTWRDFFGGLPGFGDQLRITLGLGITSGFLALLVAVGLLPLVTRWPGRTRTITLAAAMAGWCIVLLIATRRSPPGRVWLFVAPLGCVYIGMGLAQLSAWVARKVRVRDYQLAAAAAVLLALAASGYTVRRRTVFNSAETGALTAGKEIASYLLAETRPDDRLITTRWAGPQVSYYMYASAGRRIGEFTTGAATGRLLVLLNDRERQTIDSAVSQHAEVPWSEFERPTLLQQFKGASIFAARRNR